jgi:hypothetical protein
MTAKKPAAKTAAPKKSAPKAKSSPAPNKAEAKTETGEPQSDLLSAGTPPAANGEAVTPPVEGEASTPADEEAKGAESPPAEDGDQDEVEDVPAAPAAALGRGLYRNTETGEERRISVRKALAMIAAGAPIERV